MEDFIDSIQFVWWQGVVEDRNDPLQLGRCRVRILGFHPQERSAVAIEELPWAFPLQDITSAAMSGIGQSPVGPVEGTWVIGFFRDGENAQEPIMMGTIGGIPQDLPCRSGLGFFDPNGKFPLVSTNPFQDAISGLKIPSVSGIADVLGVDPALVSQAQDIASGAQGQIETAQGIATDVQSQIESAVGGSITAATGIVPSEIEVQTAAKNILSKVEGPIDSAAKDVLAGVSGIQDQADAVKDIVANAQADIQTAALGIIGNVEGLDDITAAGKAKLKGALGGILSSLSIVGLGIELPDVGISDAIKATQSKLFDAASKEVTSVLDGLPGDNAVTSLQDIAEGKVTVQGSEVTTHGIGEPDTTRLARTDEQIIFGVVSQTHPVVAQKTSVDKIGDSLGVPIESEAKNLTKPTKKTIRQIPIAPAEANLTWFEPPTKAKNTEYPFNHVFQSESGHIHEFDDTPGFERIHTFHKSGTFEEIHPSGDRMVKVVGTDYEIVHRDDNLLVKGDLNITVDKEAHILIDQRLDIEVTNGTLQINILNGNLNVQVKQGNANVFVGGDLSTVVAGNRLDRTAGNHTIECGGNFNVRAGLVTIIGATINLN